MTIAFARLTSGRRARLARALELVDRFLETRVQEGATLVAKEGIEACEPFVEALREADARRLASALDGALKPIRQQMSIASDYPAALLRLFEYAGRTRAALGKERPEDELEAGLLGMPSRHGHGERIAGEHFIRVARDPKGEVLWWPKRRVFVRRVIRGAEAGAEPAVVVKRGRFFKVPGLGRVSWNPRDAMGRDAMALDTARALSLAAFTDWPEAVRSLLEPASFLGIRPLGWALLRPASVLFNDGLWMIDAAGRALRLAGPESPFFCALGCGEILGVGAEIRWSGGVLWAEARLVIARRRDHVSVLRLSGAASPPPFASAVPKELRDGLEAAEGILTTGLMHTRNGAPRIEAVGRFLARSGFTGAAEPIERFLRARDDTPKIAALFDACAALAWTALLSWGWHRPEIPPVAPGTLAPALRGGGDHPLASPLRRGDVSEFATALSADPETAAALLELVLVLPAASIAGLGAGPRDAFVLAAAGKADPAAASRFLKGLETAGLESWLRTFLRALDRCRRGAAGEALAASGLSKADIQRLTQIKP